MQVARLKYSSASHILCDFSIKKTRERARERECKKDSKHEEYNGNIIGKVKEFEKQFRKRFFCSILLPAISYSWVVCRRKHSI